MFVLRLDFNSGLHLEYNFYDAGRGERAKTTAAAAMLADEQFAVMDEAGRGADIDGAALIAVQLIDVQLESHSILDVNTAIVQAQAAWRRVRGLDEPQPVSGEAVGRA